MVRSVFIKQDEFTGLKLGKEHDFKVRREAGTLTFHGKVTGTRGFGEFEFTPDQTFMDYLQQLGYSRLPVDKAISLFTGNINKIYLDDLRALEFNHLPMDQLIAFVIHGVSIPFIKDIRALGYKDISSDKLIAFRIHGVSPQFIREIHKAGFRDISPDKLITFRIHGVNSKNEDHKTTGKEITSSNKGMNVINVGSLVVNNGRLQLSNSRREISLSLTGWYLITSSIIHTEDIIKLYFQSIYSKTKVSFVLEPHIGTLPESQDKTWQTLKQIYKNHKIRPESWVHSEIDGLPSTTYIADYDREGKKMIEYCTYILNKEHLGLFELHVERKAFNKIKTGFDSMIQSFKWKN
jgi:hypothetical protein